MHAILRQSGRLAGISKTALRNTTRRSVRPSPLPASYQCSRCYATNKRETPDSNDEKPSDPSNAARDSGTASNGAQSPNPKASTDGKHETFPLPGYIKLSEKEEQALMNLFDTLEKFPGSKVPVLTVKKEFMHAIKEFGIPKELHDLVKKVESGVPLSMSDAMKFAAWTRRLTSQMPPHGTGSEEDQKSSNPDSETEQKTEQKTSFKSNAPQTEQKGQKGQKQKGGNFNFEFDATTALATTFMTWLVFQFINPGESSKDITWQEFRTTFFDKGLVEKLTVQAGSRVRVDLHRDLLASVYPESPAINPKFYYYFTIGSVEAFERRLDEVQNELGIPSSERIPVTYVTGSSTWLDLLISFGPTLLILGLLYSATKRVGNNSGGGGGGIFSMGKSRAKMFNHDAAVKVTFKDVAGMDEAKLEIMEFVSFLKTPEQFSRLGAKIPRGAILSGPPGTGKTLLAKATAGESGVSFFSVSGSEFVEMFVGVGASRVRDMFSTARKNTPCIIFIDEIDAIGKARGKGNYGGNDEREATLNQILTEMDGFNTSEQVVVLAGTNRLDMLDKALLRPGRFDRHIAIDRPTMEGRKQIFKVHIGKIVTAEDIEHLTGRLAALTPGFAGADIANCVNEAALIAARTSAITVEQKHFEQAIERVIGGLEKKSLVLNPEEKKTVAYHEAGHAICGWYFKYADPLLKVSIIPRGQGVLGYAQYLPTGDTYLMNVNQLMDRMAMTLGGRISEELHFETITSGASDDFQKVTHMATAMVTKWGMSKKIGPLHFPDTDEKFNKPFAESTAQSIDAEVRRIVDEAYKKCKDLLTEKKAEIGIVAEELLTKEVLGREDMIRMLGPRPFDDNKEFSKYFGGAPPPPPTERIVPPASEAA